MLTRRKHDRRHAEGSRVIVSPAAAGSPRGGETVTTPGFTGVHHVTIPVSDLQADITWFENCLAAERLPRFDHHDQDGAVFAVILELPGSGPLVVAARPRSGGCGGRLHAGGIRGSRPRRARPLDLPPGVPQHRAFRGSNPTRRTLNGRQNPRWSAASVLHRPRRRLRFGGIHRIAPPRQGAGVELADTIAQKEPP